MLIKDFLFNQRPVGVSASPPSPVSRKAEGIVLPIRYIAPITSSQGMRLVTPANAISAETMASDEPAAFRFQEPLQVQPPDHKQVRACFLM